MKRSLAKSITAKGKLLHLAFGAIVPGLLVSIPAQAVAPAEMLTQTPVPTNPEPSSLQPVPPVPLPAPAPAESIPPAPAPVPETVPVQIPVQQIEVVGSTVFDENDFAPIVQPVQGKSLTLEELRQVADQITQLYLNEGYLTSRAILVDQQIQDGVVQIRVIEGSLEAIEIEGTRRVNPAYVRSRIQLGSGTPLRQSDLEDQLRLLRIDPLFDNVEASLRAGSGLGQSILSVRVTETEDWILDLSADNLSPPDVGSERIGVVVGQHNLTGNGDLLTAAYFRSTTGGSNVFEFNYEIPLNPLQGTLALRYSPSNFEFTRRDPDDLDIQGSANLYEASFRQPVIRSPREEFALSTEFTHRTGQIFVSESLIDDTTTSVFTFGQDYVRRDPQGAWAGRSAFNFGTGLLGATTDPPDNQPDGLFFTWLGQFQRVQILNPGNLLIAQLDVQLTPDALPPSQQFAIGGGRSVRGFRQNARLGDNGIRFSVEDRITLARNEAGESVLQVAPFIDSGLVWNDSRNLNALPRQNFLAGVGLGILWQPLPDVNVRVDGAIPLVNLDDRGVNAQDFGVYFSVDYQLR